MVCGEGQCATINLARWRSAKAGGGAVRIESGEVKCGIGYCATDKLGNLKCSTKAGGGAATDSYGKVQCLGGCQDASKQLCEAAKKE